MKSHGEGTRKKGCFGREKNSNTLNSFSFVRAAKRAWLYGIYKMFVINDNTFDFTDCSRVLPVLVCSDIIKFFGLYRLTTK